MWSAHSLSLAAQADTTAPRSDSAVKQILITMNEKEAPGFIVEDLDDFHLLIKPEAEYRIRNQLEAEARLLPLSYLVHLIDGAPLV